MVDKIQEMPDEGAARHAQQARRGDEARLAREQRRQQFEAQAEERERAREERKQEHAALVAERDVQYKQTDRRQALLAAATSLGPGASPQQLYERANELLDWLRASS